MRIELALFEIDDGSGPTLLGRLSDPDLIDLVRERITASRRRELARLESPVRLLPTVESGAE